MLILLSEERMSHGTRLPIKQNPDTTMESGYKISASNNALFIVATSLLTEKDPI